MRRPTLWEGGPGETDRQTARAGHKQKLPTPSSERDAEAPTETARRERQMAASSGKTGFQSRPLEWMLVSSGGSTVWDQKEREGRATRNRLDELLPGTEPEQLLMASQQQRGLRRTSPLPALPPLVDSPDSGMSNEFIKTSSTQSWKEDECGRERQSTKQVCARVCSATAPCHPAWRRQVTPLLRDLSWLPITLRLKCKPLSWHSRPFSSWSLWTSSASVRTPPSVTGQPALPTGLHLPT